MIDVQDVRLDLLAIASATDCPMRAAAAHQRVSAERRGARSADLYADAPRDSTRALYRSLSIEKTFPSGSLNQATLPPPARGETPRSSVE
jgi:hypothetical protein